MIDPARLVASAEQVYGRKAFAQLYDTVLPVAADRVRALDDGEIVSVGERQLEVLHTRGHADHHLCLFDTASRGWFSGDMFGVSYPALRFASAAFVMPATTPTQFDPQRYAHSVERLAARDPARCYLTHYGELPFSRSQVELLLRQLRQYEAAGREHPGDEATLRERVLAITGEELRKLAPDNADDLLRGLHPDAGLNAQGIAWWSQQQAA